MCVCVLCSGVLVMLGINGYVLLCLYQIFQVIYIVKYPVFVSC